MAFSPVEMSVLRRSAAQYTGAWEASSIGARLRHCLSTMSIARDDAGQVAGFTREGFVLTPKGWAHYGWGDRAARQAHING